MQLKSIIPRRIRDLFRAAAEDSSEWSESPKLIMAADIRPSVVNYVWVNQTIQTDQDLENPIPQLYLDNMLEVKRQNPDLNVYLWIDRSLLTKQQTDYLEAQIKEDETKIKIWDLRSEIDGYRNSELFSHAAFQAEAEKLAEDKKNGVKTERPLIWRQVDLARVLVMDHVLETGQQENVFYADMDLKPEKPNLKSAELHNILNEHGAVLGKCDIHHHVENGFIGVRKGSEAHVLLHDYLLPETIKEAQEALFGNCWPAWSRFTNKVLPAEMSKLDIAVTISSISQQRSLELLAVETGEKSNRKKSSSTIVHRP